MESSKIHRRRQGVLPRPHPLAGMAALLIAVPAHAETMAPRQIEDIQYTATVNEDPAAKVCQLALALRNSSAGEGVNFQLIVAQMKQEGALAGPLVTGFTVDSHSLKFTPRPSRQAMLASAAFVSGRYSSVALPKAAPFEDGSVAASTVDFAEGRELITAVLRGDFGPWFTRANSHTPGPAQARAPPPARLLSGFSGHRGSLSRT